MDMKIFKFSKNKATSTRQHCNGEKNHISAPRTRLHLLQHANNVEARSGSSFSSGWSNKLAIVNAKQLPSFEVDGACFFTFWTFTFIVLCVKINKRETFPCL